MKNERFAYFGARYYDPKTSIFHGVDIMSDLHPNYSPYHYCFNNPINLIDPIGMDTAFRDNQARKDFKAAQNTVNSEMNSNNAEIKRLTDKGARNGWSAKKLAKRTRNYVNRNNDLGLLKADFDYICDPNTPLVSYSTNTSSLATNEMGATVVQYKGNDEVASAAVVFRAGHISSVIHENRHTRQGPDLNKCQREIPAFIYQRIFSAEDVKDRINKALVEYHGYNPIFQPVNYDIPEMVRDVYKCY